MRDIPFTLGDVSLHRIERVRQAAELVPAGDLDRGLILTLLNAPRREHQVAYGPGRAPAQQCAHDRRQHERDTIDRQQGIPHVLVRRQHLSHGLQKSHIDRVTMRLEPLRETEVFGSAQLHDVRRI